MPKEQMMMCPVAETCEYNTGSGRCVKHPKGEWCKFPCYGDGGAILSPACIPVEKKEEKERGEGRMKVSSCCGAEILTGIRDGGSFKAKELHKPFCLKCFQPCQLVDKPVEHPLDAIRGKFPSDEPIEKLLCCLNRLNREAELCEYKDCSTCELYVKPVETEPHVHEWGTDGMHSNRFCKVCFENAPTKPEPDRKAFLKLPIEERRKRLSEQVAHMVATEPVAAQSSPNLDGLMPLVEEDVNILESMIAQNTADKAITARLLAGRDERIKELEAINEQHRVINGELRIELKRYQR